MDRSQERLSLNRIAASTCMAITSTNELFRMADVQPILSDGTIDYQGRQHQIDFVLSPYYDADDLSFEDGLKTLQLRYRNTLLYTERGSQKTTGLDALGVRPGEVLYRLLAFQDPPLPIAPSNGHLSVDAEGLALNADGTYVEQLTCFVISLLTTTQLLGQRRIRTVHLSHVCSWPIDRDHPTAEGHPALRQRDVELYVRG